MKVVLIYQKYTQTLENNFKNAEKKSFAPVGCVNLSTTSIICAKSSRIIVCNFKNAEEHFCCASELS